MVEITDEFMTRMLAKTRSYCIVILKDGPNHGKADRKKIVWEHGRRNFTLRRDGVLPIVCPITDDSEVSGVMIFEGSLDAVKKIMDEDPAVKEGIFTFEMHPCKSFPGDSLP